MVKDFVGTIIFTALVVIGFLFMPMFYIAQIDMARSQEIVLNNVQLFLDKVSDTRVITEYDLDDFSLAMASTSIPIKFEITREAKQVNPDPALAGATQTSWIPVSNNSVYDSGDIIIIRVEQLGENFYQSFSMKILGMYTPKCEFTLAKMVR